MNLQRREEIRALIADQNTEDPQALTDCRNALAELLAHIDTLEQAAAERVIADGKARAVVVPEPDGRAAGLVNIRSWIGAVGPVGAMVWVDPWEAMKAAGVRAIPADRVLREGMVALRRFAERCAQRDHQPDEHIGSAKCVACEAEDALRASQGGAAT